MAEMTSTQLRAIADALRTMTRELRIQEEHVGSVRTGADTHLATAAGHWGGPRATTTLTVAERYLSEVAPAEWALADAALAIERLATTADDIAGWMVPYEMAISDVAWLQGGGLEVTPAAQRDAEIARRQLDLLSADWTGAAAAKSSELDGLAGPLETAHAAYASGFPPAIRHGDELVGFLLLYAAHEDVSLATIDPSGALQEAADERISFFGNTGIGHMYREVIETVNDGDITETDANTSSIDLLLASAAPELVRRLIVQWGAEHGITFDEQTVAYMTGEIAVTAAAMRTSDDDPWNDDRRGSIAGAGDAAVLAVVGAVPSVVAMDLMHVNGDAALATSWWGGLPATTTASLTELRPAVVGNTNGLPAAARDSANRTQMARDINELGELEEMGALTWEERRRLATAYNTAEYLEEAESLEERTTGEPPTVQLYIYDPDAFDGDGRVAVSIGDLDTAANVGVTVPGLSADARGMSPGRQWNIYQETSWAAAGDSVAIVDWMGYDAPNARLDVPDQPAELDDAVEEPLADIGSVLEQDAARAGAALLADDVEGMNAMRGGDGASHLTVIGNSYGSTTTAIAADEFGLAADDVILSGSPGAGGADSAADLTTGTENTWVASASSDPVTYFGHNDGITIRLYGALGNDPAMDTFAANRIDAENFDRGSPLKVTTEHGSYYEQDSESLYNVGAIVAGEYELVEHADHRDQEAPVEFDSPIDVSRGRWSLPLIEFDSPVGVNLWPTEPEAQREPEQMTHDPDEL